MPEQVGQGPKDFLDEMMGELFSGTGYLALPASEFALDYLRFEFPKANWGRELPHYTRIFERLLDSKVRRGELEVVYHEGLKLYYLDNPYIFKDQAVVPGWDYSSPLIAQYWHPSSLDREDWLKLRELYPRAFVERREGEPPPSIPEWLDGLTIEAVLTPEGNLVSRDRWEQMEGVREAKDLLKGDG